MATSDDLLWQAASDFFEHASSSAGPAPGSSGALVGVEGAFDATSQPHHQAQLAAHQLAVAVAHHQQLVAAASHAANAAAAPMHVGVFGEPQQALHVGSYGSTPGDGARVYLLPRSASLSALQQQAPLVPLSRGGSHPAPGELPMTLVPLMAGPQQGAVLPLTGHFAAVVPPQQHAQELLAAAGVAVPMHSSPPPGDSSSGGDADLDGWGEAPPAGGRGGRGGRGRARVAASAGGAASQSRSALAQKRFRERQKERMRSSMQRVEELSTQLEALMVERDRIQARSRLNERMLNLNLHHEARLHTDKEIMVREQDMLLEELATFVNLAAGLAPQDAAAAARRGQTAAGDGGGGGGGTGSRATGGVSVEEARGWTLGDFADAVFPQYIERLRQLLAAPPLGSNGSSGGSGSSGGELERLVAWRREHEDRRAMFSHFYWAAYLLNAGETAAAGAPPSTRFWAEVLESLRLRPEQEAAIVSARRSLLSELSRVARDWAAVLPTLALELLQVPQERWASCPHVERMVANLVAEREAVVAFVDTVCNETLNLRQEAQLEVASYPWAPDVWALSGLLARAAGAEDPSAADPLLELSKGTDVLRPLMPFATAFQLLRAPLTARAGGGRLKRALLLDTFRTVVPSAAFGAPSGAALRSLTLLEAHMGSFQPVMLYDWLKANLPCALQAAGPAAADGGAGTPLAGPVS